MTRVNAEIMPVDPLHVREICETMRETEASAIARLGRNAQALIEHELATSLMSWVGVLDGEVIALGGVKCEGILSDEAYVWVLCSEAVSRVPLAFVRGIFKILALVKERYRTIWGFVVTDFERSVRWVEWLGFTVEPPQGGVSLFWYGERPQIDPRQYAEARHGH